MSKWKHVPIVAIRPDYSKLEEIREKGGTIVAVLGSPKCPHALLQRTFASAVKKYEQVHQCKIKCMIVPNENGNVEGHAHRYCYNKEIQLYSIPGYWKALKNSAAFVRGKELSEICDGLLCYWDFESKETKAAIAYFRVANKPIMTFGIKKEAKPRMEVDEDQY